MSYQAKINNDGTYSVLKDGVLVEGAKAIRISFPEINSHTFQGQTHHISGPAEVTITIPGQPNVKGVPLV